MQADEPRPAKIWEVVGPTPSSYVPQGLASRRGRLYLSAHRSNQESALFEWDESNKSFAKVFEFPEDATHTSGIDFHPTQDDRLFAADYNSNRIYLLDFVKSKEAGRATVLAQSASGLSGTSACCVVEVPKAGPRLLVTDFRNSNRNITFSFDLQRNTLERDPDHGYRNYGFSQGIKFHAGFVFESGNSLGSSYVLKHQLADSLSQGRIRPLAVWDGPHSAIEDIAFLKGYTYVTDEKTNQLYRASLPLDGNETEKVVP